MQDKSKDNPRAVRRVENLPANVNYLRKIGVDCFNRFLNASVAIASKRIDKELVRRETKRGRNGLQWLTPDEAMVAEALANVIVPSDEGTPGLDEVDVLGPPAIVLLDKLVSSSSERQCLYSRGLLSFDIWALKRYGCKFAEMQNADQVVLFKTAQEMYESWSGRISAVVKAWRRVRGITSVRDGSFFAAKLYPQIREDCLRIFYTSRVGWIWLEYDGPPMEQGYPNLAARY